MENLKLQFGGEPRAIQSVRFAKRGEHFSKYQPKQNVDWKNFIKITAMNQLPEDWQMLDAPVGIEIEFLFTPPKSMRKRELAVVQSGGTVYKTTKPDLADNLCKGLIDALTGVVWRDDALICRVESVKRYAPVPGVNLIVRQLKNEETQQ